MEEGWICVSGAVSFERRKQKQKQKQKQKDVKWHYLQKNKFKTISWLKSI